MIVLPDKLARSEAASILRYCLAHEWSHILNHDVAQWWAVQCLQPLVWFQPLYWLLAREMRICQDQLADCFATEVVSDPVAYAELLVHFAKERCFPCTAAALTMTQGQSKLARRVLSLLDEKRNLSTICRRPIVAAFFIALVLLALGLQRHSISAARVPKVPRHRLPILRP